MNISFTEDLQAFVDGRIARYWDAVRAGWAVRFEAARGAKLLQPT